VIRNAVLHPLNDQPMLADLFEPPSPSDIGLRCTNLRLMNGKRPPYVDDGRSIFFFPYVHLRFVEIPAGAITDQDGLPALERESVRASVAGPEPEHELDIDEDFLRRVREV